MTCRDGSFLTVLVAVGLFWSSITRAIISPQERKVIQSLSTEIIAPQLKTLSAASISFVQKIEASCQNSKAIGGQTQILLKEFIRLKSQWKKSYLLTFGPLMSGDFVRQTDFRPLRRANVEKTLYSEALKTRIPDFTHSSVAVKGLPVMEYLLTQSVSHSNNLSLCHYLTALGMDLSKNAQKMLSRYNEQAHVYESGFYEKMPLRDVLVNHLIHAFNELENSQIARPFGFKFSSGSRKDLLSSALSESSKEDVMSVHEMASEILMCQNKSKDCKSILSLLPAASIKLKKDLSDALEHLGLALGSSPAFEKIIEGGEMKGVLPVYHSIQQLNRLLSADLASSLGVTLTFSDNDGD